MRIVVENITKKYKSLTAVSDVSFQINEGEIFGLLGPNGAGKTTTIEIMEGIRSGDSGRIYIDDNGKEISDQKDIKQLIGVQLQEFTFEDKLTVKETIALFASFYKHPLDTDSIIKLVSLEDKKNGQIKTLSGGQKQRLSIGITLVNDPIILFLDEPTTGLDPQARRNLWQIILDAKAKGKTIMLTTHYMEEAEKLCDRVAIMDEGKIIALDTPGNLINKMNGGNVIEFTITPELETEFHKENLKFKMIKQDETQKCLLISDNIEESFQKIFKIAAKKNIRLNELKIRNFSLEDVFIELTGKELRD